MMYSSRVPLTFEDGVLARKYSYICVSFQILVSVLARLSITILLIRLFGIYTWFRHSLVSLFCIIAVVSIAFIPITFCQVTPVQALWDPSLVVKEKWAPHIWVNYTAAQQCK